jgi:two-component system, OmpR family, alkaline phosphatase synthesis response regulator PhoP
LSRVFIIANEREQARQLRAELAQRGLDCLIVPHNDGSAEKILGQHPGVMLLDADEAKFGSEAWELAQRMRQEMNIPLIALIPREKLNGFDFSIGIDDFVVKPWEASEVTARIKRILRQKVGLESEDIIRCGDLVIDSVKCEVSLCGKPIILAFKEYQLLKFLANNKGKVFTRDVLLDKVWGWDYYGGDRTVDVHIRRLRSKIEDSTHTFIETVRNIGYKFKEL